MPNKRSTTPGKPTPPPTPPHKGEGSKARVPAARKSWHESLPFPRHWLAYVVLKLAVLALGVYFVLLLLQRSG